jgi:phthiocerol/phenolphthiocerol synthesis type-I polyketide synthase E
MNEGPSLEVGDGIAIVGLSCRFPGAPDARTFWRNLAGGVESITRFTAEELAAAGVDESLIRDPSYVRAAPVLDDVECFDAAFFGFPPRVARLLDPQHRLFLECAWHALEDAGYGGKGGRGRVGIWAGSAMNTYLLFNLWTDPELLASPAAAFQLLLGNDKDHLAPRVAYALDLRGPCATVQTACSTSLVAVHMACQSLLAGECDLALAGGVAVRVPHRAGYPYQEGLIASPDGRCRSFDADASGTIFGSGLGIVVLERLSDAIEHGAPIRAVIRGSAVNNDGAQRIGYSAPGVEGQAEVISEALAVAGVAPETIGYVEAHGSGTPLGDPIEVAAMSRAFGSRTDEHGPCAVGSVKTNVGHLEVAAGIAGLIKTVLSLENGQIPPSLHFRTPNPEIDFASGPFYVNTALADWPGGPGPRRAGVNSFGMGGCNAHVVLEEAPAAATTSPTRGPELVLLSARSEAALERLSDDLADHLEAHPELEVADVAHTLQRGRAQFPFRRALLGRDADDVQQALRGRDPARVWSGIWTRGDRGVALLFSGLGEQYVGMARSLYEDEPVFREQLDACCDSLRSYLGLDLRSVLYPSRDAAGNAARGVDLRAMIGRAKSSAGTDGDAARLDRTDLAQPAVFAIAYAQARLWESWGIRPEAVIGHSLGEWTAATYAGVFSLEDALALIARRAQLIAELPGGAMLALPLSESAASSLVGPSVAVAAVNTPSQTVVSGPTSAIEDLEVRLRAAGTSYRRLATTHAFHSSAMERVAAPLAAMLRGIRLAAPRIPLVSNLTGTWLTLEQAIDPDYWVRHLCETVRFADGIATLAGESDRALLEVGPGNALCAFALQSPAFGTSGTAIPSIRPHYDRQGDRAFVRSALARLWLGGVRIDWGCVRGAERRRLLRLPTYPFERRRFWMGARRDGSGIRGVGISTRARPEDWLYATVWRQSPPGAGVEEGTSGDGAPVLLLDGTDPLADRLGAALEATGRKVVRARRADEYGRAASGDYRLQPESRAHFVELLQAMAAGPGLPGTIVHALGLDAGAPGDAAASILALTQAWTGLGAPAPLRLRVLTRGTDELFGEPVRDAGSAALSAVCEAIDAECPGVHCRRVDLPCDGAADAGAPSLLLREIVGRDLESSVAYRADRRWVRHVERLPAGPSRTALCPPAVHLVMGGRQEPGISLAEHLVRSYGSRVVLAGPDGKERGAGSEECRRRLESLLESGAVVTALEDDLGERAVAAALEISERIDGVFLARAVSEEEVFAPFAELAVDAVDAVVAEELTALSALAHAVEGKQVGFVAIVSSRSTDRGRLGSTLQAARSWAHAAFVRERNRAGALRWLCATCEGAPFDMPGDASRNGEEPPWASWIVALERALAVEGLTEVTISPRDPKHRSAPVIDEEAAPLDNGPGFRAGFSRAYVAPRSALEARIAQLWQELFGIERIGVHDNFFELGGTSLLATELVDPLGRIAGVDLPVDAVLGAPSVGELTAVVEEARTQNERARAADVLAQLDALSDEEVERMLVERQLAKDPCPLDVRPAEAH